MDLEKIGVMEDNGLIESGEVLGQISNVSSRISNTIGDYYSGILISLQEKRSKN